MAELYGRITAQSSPLFEQSSEDLKTCISNNIQLSPRLSSDLFNLDLSYDINLAGGGVRTERRIMSSLRVIQTRPAPARLLLWSEIPARLTPRLVLTK